MNITGRLKRDPLNSTQVIALDRDYFPHPWSENQWAELNPEHHILFSWEIENFSAGFALFGHVPGDDTVHLYKIIIRPDFRRKKIASEFWGEILKELSVLGVFRVFLEVERRNLAAVKFYEKAGFKTLKINKAYYSNGDDGLMMELTL